MLSLTTLPLLALASHSLAVLTSHNGNELNKQIPPITEEDVETLNRYADYSATAPCNVRGNPGEIVSCAKVENCAAAINDTAYIFDTFHANYSEIAAYMAVSDDREEIIFVGRGTLPGSRSEEVNCNYTLVDVNNKNFPTGSRVHEGYRNALSEIYESIRDELNRALDEHPTYRIIFTGGSQGGAIATLAAANVRAETEKFKIDIYTYGAPRVGDEQLSNFITNQDGKLYRVTHNQDIVPRLPPPALGGVFKDYRHVSPEYWLMGRPADPNNWPVKDIKIYEGSWNITCISNPLNPWDWTLKDHQHYFGDLQFWEGEGVKPEPGFCGEFNDYLLKNMLEAEIQAASGAAES